jgi:hypothetical protein
MRKTAVVAVLVGSLCLFSCSKENSTSNSSQASPTASAPIGAASTAAPTPQFTVCQGTFALCTTAKCKRPEGVNGPSLSLECLCDVETGYSAGKKSCADITQAPPTQGQPILSRYSPIQSMAVCAARVVYAQCLDSPCTVDLDKSKAKCTCTAEESLGSHVVVKGTANDAMCRSAAWSSASLEDLMQITGFLYGQNPQLLKPLPIAIVRYEAAK